MGGGSAYDEEYARLIYDLERVAIDDADFERRLALLQANPNIDRDVILGPQPELIPISPIQVVQPVIAPTRTCAICKCTLNVEWVQFNRCTDNNHSFCVSCAERSIVKMGIHSLPTFRCNVCGVQTKLNGNLGLKPFIKNISSERAGRLSFESGCCPFHGDLLIYFCTECLEPICAKCHTGFHSDHDYETLDTTFSNAKLEVQELETELKDKRSEISNSVEKILNSQAKISQDAENRRRQIRDEFKILRDLLNNKERDLLNRVEVIENERITSAEESLLLATSAVDAIDKATKLVDEAKVTLTNSEPMEFVQFVFDKKQTILDVLEQEDAYNEPRHRIHERAFPYVYTQGARDSINRMNM